MSKTEATDKLETAFGADTAGLGRNDLLVVSLML